MKTKILLFLLVSSFVFSQTEKLAAPKIANIDHLKTVFKSQDVNAIAKLFQYPLHRTYPVPDVKNAIEFKERYAEIFDKTLLQTIITSKTEDWSEVGWRGIMLNNGTVWINSEDGKIVAINYESKFEKKLLATLIQKEKDSVHPSLKTFLRPEYRIDTKTYHLRIDQLSNDIYRFASWKLGFKESKKPDLILKNGVFEFQGSGGNHTITFKNGIYTYEIYRSIIGEKGHSPVYLVVKKSGVTILKEAGVLLE